jgi:opacity protein-like surface antigen
MKRFVLNSLMLAVLSLGAAAQEPSPTAKLPTAAQSGGNQVYGGFLIEPTDWGSNWSKYYGFNVNYTHTFKPRWGAVVDLDYARDNGSSPTDMDRGTSYNSHEFAYRVGPRYNLLVHRRFQPYVVALFGGANFTSKVPYPTHAVTSPIVQKDWFGFTYTFGGGVDYRLTTHLGVRGQWDWAHVPWGTETTDSSEWDRISFGATWRW